MQASFEDNSRVPTLHYSERRLLSERTRPPSLEEGQVQVFVLRADEDAARLARARGLLSPAELERAARIRVAGAREEFTVGRAALRVLLGHATGIPPEAVRLHLSAFGKPFVPEVHSSVSHSRGLIYIALCRTAAVGMDVEWIDPALEVLEIAEANFTPEEAADIAAEAEGVARCRRFCRLWTQKEAIAKADGRGLQIALRDIRVPNLNHHPAWIAEAGGGDGLSAEAREEFFLRAVPAPEGYVAALAVRGASFPITMMSDSGIFGPRGVYGSGQT